MTDGMDGIRARLKSDPVTKARLKEGTGACLNEWRGLRIFDRRYQFG